MGIITRRSLSRKATRILPALLIILLFSAGLTAQSQPAYERTSQYVAVRDGTRLAMNIYRPLRDGIPDATPMPVIFLFTPYRARYRDEDGNVREFSAGASMGAQQLLADGYVIAEADVRGKGATYGSRRGFQDRIEAQDGHDLVQWLAEQPFSNGVVGMMGCSYLGGSTLHVATTTPPALKAIFVGATDIDKFDFVRRGGITAQFNTRPDEPLGDDLMSIPVDADAHGAMLREAVAQHADNTSMAGLWYSMPFRDSVSPLTGNAFWEEVGPYPYLQNIRDAGIATYFWSNLRDEPTAHALLLAANLDGKLLVGPGGHCAPPPDYDLGGEVKRFFDFHLKGINTGIEDEPDHTWWVENATGDEHWIRSDFLPGELSVMEAWHLGKAAQADGLMSVDTLPADSLTFTVDYDLGDGEYFSFWVDAQDAHGPTFTSEVLQAPLRLEGYPVAHLQVSADREDANVFVYLEEVDTEGDASVLAMGRLAAGYRKISQAPFDMLGLPWHSGREEDYQPLVPGEPVTITVALLPVSHIVPAGHRLRLVVTGADRRQRNLEAIRQSPPPELTLHLGGQSGSFISLPVRQ